MTNFSTLKRGGALPLVDRHFAQSAAGRTVA